MKAKSDNNALKSVQISLQQLYALGKLKTYKGVQQIS